MTYLLDTNACVQLLKANQDSAIAKRLAQHTPADIRLCAPVKGELFYGADKSVKRRANLERLRLFCRQFQSIPFNDEVAKVCGQIRAALAAKGTPIGLYDLQIAAIALVHDLTLVTDNVREFSRVDGLARENWQEVG
ncbi:type II toxin-antitoxin system VapC family toxin [Acaryochloris sp. CCMEE 5410]|uniref:type II toxin-antitoxin system VapC family toxin n=1 Tax=Acaryochloris sp. CCMEE 5410 TaxID=310037 RepID=UPI00024851A8|nr:type II toxin-antitoxin system VapC family toxin [Acaryochloris sp. CCMEE 5410]KAI9130041.1 type II toxin-antitoxin system VapC family toxin [Acaryochloris sp. CCMEE 5410]